MLTYLCLFEFHLPRSKALNLIVPPLLLLLLLGSSNIHAAYKENVNPLSKFEHKKRSDLYPPKKIGWEKKQYPSMWDKWKYDFGASQLLTGKAKETYYGFGFWKPEDNDDDIADESVTDWILDHGFNLSLSTKAKEEDVRYRIDMRWHEDSNTEFLFQVQLPFK